MNFDTVRPNLYRAYWFGVVTLILYAVFHGTDTPPLQFLLGVGLAAIALFPFYLWCAGKVDGLPIFPLFAMTHVWTFAMPLITQNKSVIHYPPSAQMEATLTAMVFIIVATMVWLLSLGRRPEIRPFYQGFATKGNNWAFLLGMVAALVVLSVIRSGDLPEGAEQFISFFQSVSMSTTILCATVLSFRLGKRQLGGFELVAFLLLFMMIMMVYAVGLILNSALAMVLVAIGVFTISRGRTPIVALGIAFVVFSLLHIGKWDMRDKYLKRGFRPISLDSIPYRYLEWFGHGFEHLPAALAGEKYSSAKHSSLVERGSLLQMLMLVQSKTPDFRDYLNGKTYVIIPELLVPRFLNPQKIRAHQGTYILSIYYGLQDRKATNTTTIAFGLLSESYANFGYIGVLGLAVLMGTMYGLGTRISIGAPVTSFRGLVGLFLLASTMSVEHTAGVFVTSLFQGMAVLCFLGLVAMRPQPTPEFQPRKITQPQLQPSEALLAGGVS